MTDLGTDRFERPDGWPAHVGPSSHSDMDCFWCEECETWANTLISQRNELLAENERLLAQSKHLAADRRIMHAENERLRAELQTEHDIRVDTEHAMHAKEVEIERLRVVD